MRRFRIKSYRADSHVIQKRYLGFLWVTPLGEDVRYMQLRDAVSALERYIKETTGYPRISKVITEDEVWK